MVSWSANLLVPRIDFVIADIIVRSVVISLVFGSLTWWIKVSPEANGLLERALKVLRG
jgi:hypothetical protein